MHLVAIFNFAQTLVPATVAAMIDAGDSFSRLTSIGCRNENVPSDELYFGLSDIGPFLRLPALQTLRAWNMRLWANDPLPKSHSIRSVRTLSNEVEESIRNIIEAFVNLRELEIVTEEQYIDVGSRLDQEEVGNVLRQYGRKLEKLIWDVRLMHVAFGQDCARLGDLSPMTNLRELGISLRSLLGPPVPPSEEFGPWPRLVDVLPTGLEILTLLYRYTPPNRSVSQEEDQDAGVTFCDILLPSLYELLDSGCFWRLREIELENLWFLPELDEALAPGWAISEKDVTIERGVKEQPGLSIVLKRV